MDSHVFLDNTVGFLGNGVTKNDGGGDKSELGRFTVTSNDLTQSSLFKVGNNKNFARIDICNGSSIFQQRGVHGDNLYLSCLAHYEHKIEST